MPPDPSRTVVIRYDRNGFRNAKTLETAEVVVIGDSYVEGYLMSDEHLLTTHLSKLQGMSVANLGHSGYGPQQELAVLRRFGLPLKPKPSSGHSSRVMIFRMRRNTGHPAARRRARHRPWQDFWRDFWFAH